MSKLRRYFKEGETVFVTLVTHDRLPILVTNSDLLLSSIDSVKRQHAFKLVAIVILPDHIHCIIEPRGDSDISSLVQRIKMSFGVKYRGRMTLRSGRIWQNRFWDRIIRDEKDMRRHIDYIHYNPVRHKLVKSPFDWQVSSIHWKRYKGVYATDWGTKEPIAPQVGVFGESRASEPVGQEPCAPDNVKTPNVNS